MRQHISLVAILFLSAWLGYGCGGDDNPTVSDSNGNGGDTGNTSPTFSVDIAGVISRGGCAASSCHGQARTAGMELSPGVAYSNLVNVASSEVPAIMRVAPGMAGTSYIVMKIERDSPPSGTRMPPPPRAALSAADIELIRLWIDSGAQDN